MNKITIAEIIIGTVIAGIAVVVFEQFVEPDDQQTTEIVITIPPPPPLDSRCKDSECVIEIPPGCVRPDSCTLPKHLDIVKGFTVTWKNNISNYTNITTGSAVNGPDGEFDSGLIESGKSSSLYGESC